MRPFVLLQLSDLHFGPNSRFAGVELGELAQRCAQAIREARSQLEWREEVGLVLVTGDIAEAARPKEYESALGFFGGLVEGLGVSRSSVVFVPGNHDVSWTRCKEIEGQLEDGLLEEKDLRANLDAVKLTRFDDMVARFYDPLVPPHDGVGRGPARPATAGSVTALARGAHVHDFEGLSVSVAALDSCEVESHRNEDHRGFISEEQAQSVLSHWRAGATPADRIRILAIHHNPVPTIPAAIREWRDWLRSQVKREKLDAGLFEHFAADAVGFEGHERLQALAADAQVSLLFHGHHHASDAVHAWSWRGKRASGDTRIISAGSWGLVPRKLPAEQPVVMQLVRIDPTDATVRPVLLRYEPRARADGVVERGAFVLDEVTRGHAVLGLSLPASASGASRKQRPKRSAAARLLRASGATAAAALVAAYRARKRDTFVRWDLRAVGAAPTVGSSRPIEASLDDMYIPLRFGPRYDLEHLGSGAPIDAERLLEREVPLVIIGNAGSGKTTWMKRTFRQLVQTGAAVPFFLELRAIAASWDKRTDGERTIEVLLADDVKACGVAAWESGLAEILEGRGPRPVLLVDGWDELGDLGERVRKCLSEFRAAHERVVIVVSSRPYGEGRPAGSEGFETLEIQPLDDADIRLLTHKFHRRVHGEEAAAAERSTDDFMARLRAVPEAQALAHTALLLTMMLLLSREGPLPDKRHKLYLACLRNLLDARPALRESEGAQLRHNEWRPDDQDARLRAVSEMSYRMQSDEYQKARRGPIVRLWEEAIRLLPGSWTRDQREGFLLWLINSAGVLVDRTDGAISFAHLSFQEFLAAHFLFATLEGDARVEAVLAHGGDLDWWETLRLWSGLTGDLSPAKLAPVLAALRQTPHTFWLVGSILADGTGPPADFEAWRREVGGGPARRAWAAGHQCARAWAASKQRERRDQLAAVVAAAASSAHWLDGAALADWGDTASMAVGPSPALVEVFAPTSSGAALARSRALAGSSWRWPDAGLVALLRLWPSGRTRASLTLQILAGLGAELSMLLRVARAPIDRARRPAVDRNADIDFVLYLARYLHRYFGLEPNQLFGEDLVRDFARDFVRDYGTEFGLYIVRDFERNLDRDLARDFVRDLAQDFVPDFGQGIAAAWGVDPDVSETALWQDFGLIEAASAFGRASVRAAVAHGKLSSDRASEVDLFQPACRVSLGREPAPDRLLAALARHRGDPLWPALARHVARLSTPEDRSLLEDAAARPEHREPPVSWALQYYARGDIVMSDGAVITMDEICDALGAPHLPLLEDMAGEIEIDLAKPAGLLGPE